MNFFTGGSGYGLLSCTLVRSGGLKLKRFTDVSSKHAAFHFKTYFAELIDWSCVDLCFVFISCVKSHSYAEVGRVPKTVLK